MKKAQKKWIALGVISAIFITVLLSSKISSGKYADVAYAFRDSELGNAIRQIRITEYSRYENALGPVEPSLWINTYVYERSGTSIDSEYIFALAEEIIKKIDNIYPEAVVDAMDNPTRIGLNIGYVFSEALGTESGVFYRFIKEKNEAGDINWLGPEIAEYHSGLNDIFPYKQINRITDFFTRLFSSDNTRKEKSYIYSYQI